MTPPILYQPIGIVRTPFDTPEGTPIQPSGGADIEGEVEVYPEYRAGLEDLSGFSHIILLYHCHLGGTCSLRVKPFLDDAEHGVFATRAPSRPNPIGLSVVRLLGVADGKLSIKEVDIVNGSPLLDIKPYVPKFDVRSAERTGWLEKRSHKTESVRDDGRFAG